MADNIAPVQSQHIKVGIVTGLAVCLCFLAVYKSGIDTKYPASQFLFAFVFALGLAVNGFIFGKINGYQVSFGQAFSNSFKAGLIITLFWVAYDVISLYAFPEIKQSQIDRMEAEKVIHSTKMTNQEIDKSIADFKAHYHTMLLQVTVFWSLIINASSSVMGGMMATMRKRIA